MLESWFLHIPTDPLEDLRQAATGETGSRNLKRWNLLQAAFSWGEEERTRCVVEELVLRGTDMNARALCGLNALHLIILLLFVRRDVEYDTKMLEWWMSKGADVAAMAVEVEE